MDYKQTIDNAKEANELCLKLWDLLEQRHGDSAEIVFMPFAKRVALMELGYSGLSANCPLCHMFLHHMLPSSNCTQCPIHPCNDCGYKSKMTGEEIKAFNAELKEKLVVE